MPSWQTRIAAFIVRRRVKPALGDMRDIGRVRKVFNAPLPVPRGVRVTPAALAGVPGEWVEAAPAAAAATAAAATGSPPTTLLYIHGGGFVGCSPRSHRSLTASFALRGLRVYVPDYRLAPEHPFPAAVDDVVAVWRALRRETAGRLVVAGDSAGGNLAVALMLALRDAGEPLPDAAALYSPALDLTGGSRSLAANSPRDPMFDGPSLQHLADAYLAGADAAQPLVSPLLARLDGLPPVLVHVGESEVLRDDSLRFARQAAAAGVPVELRVFAGVPHVWQLLWRLPEARRSIDDAARFLARAQRSTYVEHHDVVIVGAGLSGIGAAAHLQDRCPGTDWTILEARQALGGTWDLFRYPGVRSDSDMYTLGYEFKPWTGAKSIADGDSIRAYIAETAAERGIDQRIRYGHRVVRADWSTERACWSVEVERGEARERGVLTCRFLLFCSGYFRYDRGYRPPLPGEEHYRGTFVHPQFWPERLDYAGKRVLVVGSGATAVTLVPALAEQAAQVTMLQRSPSYVVARPAHDAIAAWLHARLPTKLAYRLVRLKNVCVQMYYFKLARRWPQQTKQRIVAMARSQLAPDYDMAHFTPRYNPWDQRVCLVPDADLFRAIRGGRVEIATDTIATFTERGVRLESGREIDADIVVTATGLELNVLGDVAVSLDGRPCDLSRHLTYKGLMYDGIPNLASTFGYTNASWTLRADLTANYVCRLLRYMQRKGYAVATPRRGDGVVPAPFIDFTSGYVQRALDRLPKQGSRRPWRLYQNYLLDVLTLRLGGVADAAMSFERAAPAGDRGAD